MDFTIFRISGSVFQQPVSRSCDGSSDFTGTGRLRTETVDDSPKTILVSGKHFLLSYLKM